MKKYCNLHVSNWGLFQDGVRFVAHEGLVTFAVSRKTLAVNNSVCLLVFSQTVSSSRLEY